MEKPNSGEGWMALSDVSSFMSHVEQRKKLSIFGELDARLDYCQYLIRSQIHHRDKSRFLPKNRKKELNGDLIHALKSLAVCQLIYYYNIMVQQLINLTNNIYNPPKIDNNTFLIIEAYSRSYNLKIWKRKKLRFDRQKQLIYAEKDKKIKIYDLSNYILRKSANNDYLTLVLEAINNIPLQKSRTVHLGFQFKNTFNLWYNNIRLAIEYKQLQNLTIILNKKHLFNTQSSNRIKQEKQEKILNSQPKQIVGQQFELSSRLKKMVSMDVQIEKRFRQKSNQTCSQLYSSQKKVPLKPQNLFSSPCNSISSDLKTGYNFQDINSTSFVHKLIYQKLQISLEQLQFELQAEEQDLKHFKRKISFQKTILGNRDIETEDLLDLINFKQIDWTVFDQTKFAGEVGIYQNITDHNNLRCVYSSPQELNKQRLINKSNNLIQHLLDPAECFLNANIAKNQIKTVIYSESSTIHFQQNLAYNRLYRPREFIFIRHTVRDSLNQVFIIDRSIKQQDFFPQNCHFVRGNLTNVYRISIDQINNKVVVVADYNIMNQGQLTQSQNVNLSKQHITKFAQGLSSFFSQQKEIKKNNKFYNLQSRIGNMIQSKNNISQVDSKQEIFNFSVQSIKQSLPFERKKKQRKESSFYQIGRDHFVKNKTAIYNQVQQQKYIQQMRNRGYEPPRKLSNQYLNPKLPFLKEKSNSKFDWKIITIPPWKIQWNVDQQIGGLIRKKNLKSEKEKLKKVLQTVTKKTLTGKNIAKLSFPVDILAPESNLQRLLHSLTYAPSIFDNNLRISIIQKFKKVITFGILTSLLSLNTQKSFDPLLGETYQSEISDNCSGYAEQISVNPSISALYLLGSQYSISAIIHQRLKILMNSVQGENEGIYKVKFVDDTQICFTTPPGQLSGLIFGESKFLLQKRSYFWIQTFNLVLQLCFEINNAFSRTQDAKQDYFEGTIYQIRPEFMQQFLKNYQRPGQKDIVRTLNNVSGRWTKYINFGDQTIDLKSINLYEMNSDSQPLPSDASYRQDINELKHRNLQKAQQKKDELQLIERTNIHLRGQYESNQ